MYKFKSNKLTLNTTKTNFVIFHPYQKKVTYQLSLYMFDNEKNGNVTQESKNYIKYLGVLIDKNLTWKYHIDAITAKISKTVGLISKLRHSIPRHILLYLPNINPLSPKLWSCCLGSGIQDVPQ